MKNLDLKSFFKIYIKELNIVEHEPIEKCSIKKEFKIFTINNNDVFIFNDYEEYQNYYLMYIDNAKSDIIDKAIFFEGTKGHIIAYKCLCEHIIATIKMNEFYNSLIGKQISLGDNSKKLSPMDIVRYSEKLNICLFRDYAASTRYRCNFFNHNCLECKKEFVSHKEIYENEDYNTKEALKNKLLLRKM